MSVNSTELMEEAEVCYLNMLHRFELYEYTQFTCTIIPGLCRAGNKTQGLMHAREVLYQLSQDTQPKTCSHTKMYSTGKEKYTGVSIQMRPHNTLHILHAEEESTLSEAPTSSLTCQTAFTDNRLPDSQKHSSILRFYKLEKHGII